MLSEIMQNKKFPKYDWPRAKNAVAFHQKKILLDGLIGDKLNSKIGDDKSIVKKNTGFHNLEDDILSVIFSYFNERELSYSISRVSRHWYNAARQPKLWKKLEFKAEKIDTATICNILWRCRELEKLSLVNMENPLTVIRQMCRCNRLLKHIKILNCRCGKSDKIPESVLRNILHSCKYLESIDLNGSQFSATRFYNELANLTRLKKLNLNNSKYLMAKDLLSVSLNCRNLEDVSITISENSLNSLQISDQDAVFLFKNLSNTLKRVDFDTTGLTGPSFEAILSCPNLEKLSLRHALFLSSDIFCNYIQKLHGLKQLRLTHASQLVSEDFIFLSQKHIFNYLNLLDLSGCGRISDVGLKSLLQCCRNGLTYLNLKSCKSIRDLNFIIDNCKKLQYLNIAHSSYPDPTLYKNLTNKLPKLNKLVIDKKSSDSDLTALHICAPKLKLLRSMSEFHKDEKQLLNLM